MRQGYVVEIDGWAGLSLVPHFADDDDGAAVVGVLIKATQGTAWAHPHLDQLAADASRRGLLVGLLHYASSLTVEAQAAADFAMLHVPDQPVELGQVVEIDGPGQRPSYELGTWVQTWADLVGNDSEPAGLMAPASLVAEMPGAPWALRLWLPRLDADTPAQAFAWGGADVRCTTMVERLAAYELATLRGVNPPAVAPPAPPKGAKVAKGATKATAGRRRRSGAAGGQPDGSPSGVPPATVVGAPNLASLPDLGAALAAADDA